MARDEYLIMKKNQVESMLQPYADPFKIKIDYQIDNNERERLVATIENRRKIEVSCTANSLSAIFKEFIGILFIVYGKDYYGSFTNQTFINVKQMWISDKIIEDDNNTIEGAE